MAGILKVSERYLGGVWNVLKVVWKVFGGCLEGVWNVSGGCLEGVRKHPGRGLEGIWKTKKCFGPKNCKNFILDQAFIWTQIFFGTEFFTAENLLEQKFFWTQNNFRPKFFLTQHFFGLIIFLESNSNEFQ